MTGPAGATRVVVLSLPIIATCFVVGLLVSPALSRTGWEAWLGLGAVALGTLAAFVSPYLNARPGIALRLHRSLFVAVAVAASIAGIAAGGLPFEPRAPPEGLARVVGYVEEVMHRRGDADSILRVERGARIADGHTVTRGIRLRVRGRALPEGATVRLLLRIRALAHYRNMTPHPAWPLSPQAHAWAEALPNTEPQVLGRSIGSEWLASIRNHVRITLDATLDAGPAGLARALVLGDARAVAREDHAHVRDAGLLHVLAVSGLHVAIVAGWIVALLRACVVRLPWIADRFDARRVAAALGVPLALVYAAFSGGSASAWRAALTAAIAWMSIAFGRRPNALAVGAAAVIVLGCIAPADAGQPGFLLSVLGTAALLTAPSTPVTSARQALRNACVLHVRAMLATAPVVAWHFDSVPAIGLIGNLVLVPMTNVVLLPLAFVHTLLATLSPPLASLTASAWNACAIAFVSACEALSTIRLGTQLPPLSVAQGWIVAAACAALLVVTRRRWRLAVLAAAILGTVAAEAHLRRVEQPPGLLRATVLDVGQGDAILVDFPDRSAMLIDAGGSMNRANDPGRRTLVPLLRARRRDHLRILALTHPHPDHYGGMDALLGAVRIDELWDNGQAGAEDANGMASKLVARARHEGARVRGPSDLCGSERSVGRARVRILWPCPSFDAGFEENDNSFVIHMQYGRRRFLFTGDIEEGAESMLLSQVREGMLRADVLKVAHHGSRTSSTLPFLEAVRPRLAIVSCGLRNRFGHPHGEVLDALRSASTTVMRTDTMGSVTVTTDGESLEVETWSGIRKRWPS